MQFVLPLLYSAVFILIIYKIKFFALDSLSRNGFALLFAIKLLAALVVCFVYTYHYALSDYNTYFADSKVFAEQLFGSHPKTHMSVWNSEFEHVLFNNSKVIIVINALLLIFSFGNLYVHIVFFCFFSFAGLTALYHAFVFYFPGKSKQLIFSVFLVPTILFWSSTALKESLVIAVVGLIVYISMFGLKQKYSIKEMLVLLALILFLLFIKIFVAAALLPVLLANGIIAKTSVRYSAIKYVGVFALLIILLIGVKLIHSDYNVLQLLADRRAKAISEAKGGVFLVSDKNFICVEYNDKERVLEMKPDSTYRIRAGSNYLSWKLDNMKDTSFITNSSDTAVYRFYYSVVPAKTVLNVERLQPEVMMFLKHAPLAVFNVLFQPTIFGIKSWLHLAVAIENMWILVFILLAIFFVDREVIKNKSILFFCLVFSIVVFAIIGFTTPVVGSMIRYRTIGLLFLIPILLLLVDEDKLRKRLFRKN